MNPTQPSNPDESSQGYYSVGGGTDRGIRPSREGIFKWIKRGMFGLTILAIIGGSLYGVNHFFGVAAEEREKLALARAANDAAPEDDRVYFGDGTDIAEVASAESIVGCPTGYDDKNGKCEKEETVTVNSASYSCPDGYTKKGDGSSTDCVKIINGKVETRPATQTQSCTDDYVKSGDVCSKIVKTDLTITYSCQPGLETSGFGAGTKCTKTDTQSGNVLTSCPSGYGKSGNSCVKAVDANASTSSSTCPSGGSLSGSTCTRTATASKVYGCPNNSYRAQSFVSDGRGTGYCRFNASGALNTGFWCESKSHTKLSGANVVRIGTEKYECRISSVVVNYQCQGGWSRTGPGGQACVTTYGATPGATTYSCSGTNPAGSKCYYYASPSYNCELGFAKSGSGSGTVCIKININNVSANTKTSCADQYIEKDRECQKTVTAPAKLSYACSDRDFTLAGTECNRTVGGTEIKTEPKISYACPSGYKANGTGADLKCEITKISTAEKVTRYECKDGWTRRQSGPTFDCVLIKV